MSVLEWAQKVLVGRVSLLYGRSRHVLAKSLNRYRWESSVAQSGCWSLCIVRKEENKKGPVPVRWLSCRGARHQKWWPELISATYLLKLKFINSKNIEDDFIFQCSLGPLPFLTPLSNPIHCLLLIPRSIRSLSSAFSSQHRLLFELSDSSIGWFRTLPNRIW